MSIAKHKPRCFIDVEIGGVSVGRVIFELYADKCPKTAENFRTLCTGEGGIGKKTGKPLHYKGTVFHRVVKDFMVQSGDFSNNNGTGGESIYGPTFPDENLEMKHEVPYLLSMANRGPNTNSSQFFITTQPAQHLDGIHVVFGHVISGQGVVKQIEGLPVDRMSRPLQDARIANCGELVPKTKPKEEKKKKKKEQDSSSLSSEEEKEENKKKKKKQKQKSKSDKESDMEEGELKEPELPLHPLATVTHMKEDEIPDVPKNKFLDRGGGDKDKDKDRENNRDFKRRGNYDARDRWNGNNRNGRDRMKNSTTKSGRKIKGRGSLRYRTPSRSRSRSRTPPHWRQEQKRTISLKEYEEKEKEKREHEEELRRREEERKKRHEERERKEKEVILERELKEMERQLNMGPSLTETTAKEPDEASPPTRSPELQPPGVNMDMDDLDYEAMETTENVEEEPKASQLEEAAGLPLSADKPASKAANGHESDSSGQALDSEALEDLRSKDKARSKLPSPESEDIRQRFHSREEAGKSRGAVKQPVTGNSKVPADFDSRSPSRSKTPLYAHLLEKETPEAKQVPPTVAGAGTAHHPHPKTRVEDEPVETIPLLINRKEAHVDVRKSKSPDRAARNRSASKDKDKDNNKDRDVKKRSRRSNSREREHHQHRGGNRDHHRDQGSRDRRDRGDRRRKSRSRGRNRSRRH